MDDLNTEALFNDRYSDEAYYWSLINVHQTGTVNTTFDCRNKPIVILVYCSSTDTLPQNGTMNDFFGDRICHIYHSSIYFPRELMHPIQETVLAAVLEEWHLWYTWICWYSASNNKETYSEFTL